jgi:hypothetical protein
MRLRRSLGQSWNYGSLKSARINIVFVAAGGTLTECSQSNSEDGRGWPGE